MYSSKVHSYNYIIDPFHPSDFTQDTITNELQTLQMFNNTEKNSPFVQKYCSHLSTIQHNTSGKLPTKLDTTDHIRKIFTPNPSIIPEMYISFMETKTIEDMITYLDKWNQIIPSFKNDVLNTLYKNFKSKDEFNSIQEKKKELLLYNTIQNTLKLYTLEQQKTFKNLHQN